MTNTNEILGLKSIQDNKKEKIGEIIKSYLTLGWTFDKPIEKLILVILTVFGLWKIIGFFN